MNSLVQEYWKNQESQKALGERNGEILVALRKAAKIGLGDPFIGFLLSWDPRRALDNGPEGLDEMALLLKQLNAKIESNAGELVLLVEKGQKIETSGIICRFPEPPHPNPPNPPRNVTKLSLGILTGEPLYLNPRENFWRIPTGRFVETVYDCGCGSFILSKGGIKRKKPSFQEIMDAMLGNTFIPDEDDLLPNGSKIIIKEKVIEGFLRGWNCFEAMKEALA